MGVFRIAVLAVIISTGVIAQPAPRTDVSRPAPAPTAPALELVEHMAPRELVLQAKLREFDRNFGPSLLLNQDIKKLEADFPGSVAAMTAASRPLLAEQMVKLVGRVHKELAEFLMDQFSSDELTELARFYGSPHGRGLNQAMTDSVDLSAAYRSMAETGAISEATLGAQRDAAIKSTKGKLSDEDTKALLAFAQTPTFSKLRQVRPKIRELIYNTFAAPDPDYDRRAEIAIEKALEAHIVSLKAKDQN